MPTEEQHSPDSGKLKPEIIIGDQDSSTRKPWHWQGLGVLSKLCRPGRIRLISDLAVEYAAARGGKHNDGRRLGQPASIIPWEILNCSSASASAGIENWLLTRDHRLSAFLHRVSARVQKEHVSLIPSPEVRDVSLQACSIFAGATLRKGSTLSIKANAAAAEDISGTLAEGVLLAVI